MSLLRYFQNVGSILTRTTGHQNKTLHPTTQRLQGYGFEGRNEKDGVGWVLEQVIHRWMLVLHCGWL